MVTGITVTGNVNTAMTAISLPVSGDTVDLKDAIMTTSTSSPTSNKSDRRSNKPIMEKRRRARINNCLNELKILILDATKKDPARHSKLEKADILEKTVKHLQELQRQQATLKQAANPKLINKFKAGFNNCVNEVSRFPGLEPSVKRRLVQHLNSCIYNVKADLHQHNQEQRQCMPSPPSSPEQQDQHQSSLPYTQIQHTVNGYFLPSGLQVIPTKLPNGSIALVLPQLQSQQQQSQLLIPSRTPSTGSASSHSSSASSSLPYAPPSPANSYEAMDCKTTTTIVQHVSAAAYQQQQQQQQQQHHQPLSLVIKKVNIKREEEQPWRPW